MSISLVLAVTMMTGVRWPQTATARHTSIPETRGSVMSHQSSQDGAELIERFGTVTGHLHPEAFTLQAYDKGVDKRRFVLDDEDGHLLRHWPAPAARLKEREIAKVGPPSSPARR